MNVSQLKNRNQTSPAQRLLQELQACHDPASQLSWAAFSHSPSIFPPCSYPSCPTQINSPSAFPSWQIISTVMLRGDGWRFGLQAPAICCQGLAVAKWPRGELELRQAWLGICRAGIKPKRANPAEGDGSDHTAQAGWWQQHPLGYFGDTPAPSTAWM